LRPHRLHPATALLNAVVIVVFVLGGYALLITQAPRSVALGATPGVRLGAGLTLGFGAAIAGFWGWWSLRFWIAGDDLVVETGILRHRARRVPLSRVQAVDVVRPMVTRLVRLAEVRVQLAGGDRAETKFRYLGLVSAERLRAELLFRAAGLHGHAQEAPERPYWRVGFGTLLGSQVLRLPVVGALVLLVALLAFGVAYAEPGVLAGVLPLLLGLARGVIAPLVTHGNFTAAVSPDGVRLRHGLMETRMQTVPPGRVQAVRVVEPLLWRGFGWARLDVTVAGYVGGRQALSSTLLPVAPRQVALGLVGMVFPGTNIEAVPLLPPSRPWLRTGAVGTDDAVFVARRGRVCRRLDVIAHARAQSVRLTAGPLQRLLGLGTVHIDGPPGPVQVAAENRDLAEARAITEAAAQRAHRARAADTRRKAT
jgi:putative membrane protein